MLGQNPRGGLLVDRSIFYPTGGGQPGDSGRLERSNGQFVEIATTVKGDQPDEIVLVPSPDQTLPVAGEIVTMALDWERRYRHMRMHSCLHLLSAILPHPVTGGQIAEDKGRLDFDMDGAPPEKEALTEALNALITADEVVTTEWISDEELAAQPELVKTMAVKPPSGSGRVRLVRISTQDLQPCGGTHVHQTGEIGTVAISKIASKGKQNRRVTVVFADGDSAT